MIAHSPLTLILALTTGFGIGGFADHEVTPLRVAALVVMAATFLWFYFEDRRTTYIRTTVKRRRSCRRRAS